MQEIGDQDESVRHLVELGYTDPVDEAAQAAALRPQNDARLFDAERLYRDGLEPDAIQLLKQLAEEDPHWIAPHRQLAAIHYRAGRFDDAQAELNWLAYHGVENPRLAAMEGHIAIARRELLRALELLEYATYLEPEIPGALCLLGVALLRLNRLDEADHAFQKSLERNPLDARSLDGRSAIALRKRAFDAAADHALSALEHDMHLFSAHYHLGVALTFLNRPTEAATALETAARLDPGRAAPYRWLSQIAQTQLANSESSRTYLERGKEITRRRREARRQRAIAR